MQERITTYDMISIGWIIQSYLLTIRLAFNRLRFDRSAYQRVPHLVLLSFLVINETTTFRQASAEEPFPSHCFITTTHFIQLTNLHINHPAPTLWISDQLTVCLNFVPFSGFSLISNIMASTMICCMNTESDEDWRKIHVFVAQGNTVLCLIVWMGIQDPFSFRVKLSRLTCKKDYVWGSPNRKKTPFIAAFKFLPRKAVMEYLNLTLTTQYHLQDVSSHIPLGKKKRVSGLPTSPFQISTTADR